MTDCKFSSHYKIYYISEFLQSFSYTFFFLFSENVINSCDVIFYLYLFQSRKYSLPLCLNPSQYSCFIVPAEKTYYNWRWIISFVLSSFTSELTFLYTTCIFIFYFCWKDKIIFVFLVQITRIHTQSCHACVCVCIKTTRLYENGNIMTWQTPGCFLLWCTCIHNIITETRPCTHTDTHTQYAHTHVHRESCRTSWQISMFNYIFTIKRKTQFVFVYVLYTTDICLCNKEWKDALIWKLWILDTLSDTLQCSVQHFVTNTLPQPANMRLMLSWWN